jgi:hypothetical protein
VRIGDLALPNREFDPRSLIYVKATTEAAENVSGTPGPAPRNDRNRRARRRLD